ncbi:MAG: two-component regulator propeller domain-containing protein [Bacteroidota bacterium]
MKNWIHIVILLLLQLFFSTGKTTAQPVDFRRYQVDDGLSNNTVFCTLQDKKGFMWFGTKVGLNRFDGHNFKTFNNSKIRDANIYALHEDSDSLLWVGTDRGLFKYDALKEFFLLVKGTENIQVRDIQEDKYENIWYIKGSELQRINKTGKVTLVYQKEIPEMVTSVCLTSDSVLVISNTKGEVEKFAPETNSFNAVNVFANSPASESHWIERIADAGNGLIFIGTSNQGVKLFNTYTNTYSDVLTYDNDHTEIFARDFVRYDKDNFWIATESGIFQYNMVSGKYIQLTKKYNNPYSLSDNAVYALCKDKEGGIWAGTYFGGVNYHPSPYMSFEKYFPQEGSNTLRGNAVREICPDGKGNLWIGTEDAGLHKMVLSTGKFTSFYGGTDGKKISHTNIHGLLVNGTQLWIGTFEHGLDVMDITKGKLIKRYLYGDKPGQLKSNFISSLYLTKNDTILIGTSRGLYIYNKNGDDFSFVNQVPPTHIKDILEDNSGKIWLSTLNDGIFTLDFTTGISKHFVHNEKKSTSLPSNLVNSVFEDSRHQVWITTEAGFCKYVAFDSFKNYTTVNGLNSNVTYRMLEDASHQFWITTANGLVLFDPDTDKIKNYFKANGLLSDQFNYNSSYKDSTGKMYFGCIRGMISFNPNQFEINNYIPPVYITGFQVGNKELIVNGKGDLQNSLLYTSSIELPYDRSSFSIDFAALSFTSPELVEYSYNMQGLEKNWTNLKTNRKVYFTELAPGEYVFKLRATNSSGVWNPSETSLVIVIHPPFWASGWAYFIYIVLGIALTILIVSNYHQRVNARNQRKIEKLQNDKEKEIYKAKIDFFTNVAHEIKTPLALIKGPMEEIINAGSHNPLMGQHLKIMERNTKRLTDLTTQLLDFRNVESSEFRLSFLETDITAIVQEYYLNFKPVAERKKVEFILKTPETPLLAFVDAEAFSKILSNLYDNAIKYADTYVHVQLMPNRGEDFFVLQIENDGYLVPNDSKEKIFEPLFRLKTAGKQQGSGIGLALARSLTELHRGILKMDMEVSDKNVFFLQLPVQHILDKAAN